MTEPSSFLKSLFFGVLDARRVHPFPHPSADDRETASMILETFREFATAHLDGGKFDRDHVVPPEVRQQLGEMGILGLTIPEEHGGAGLGYTTYCRIMEETNRHCGSTAVIVGGHQSIGIKALILHGTQAQQHEWLPKLATGEWMAAYALSEPEAGSDPAGMRTFAEEQPDGSYILTGQKIWITNGGFADFMTVFAKTDDGQGGRKVTCFVLTPKEMASGFRRGAEEKKMGLRGSSTTQLFFDGCPVPAANILGEKGRGLKVAFEVLNYGRTSLAAGCVGASKRMFEEASKHAAERVQFGKPIAEFELVAKKLAEMASDIYATESITYLTTAMADAGDVDFSVEAACCKVFSTEAHWRACNHAVQIAGGIAYVEEYPYERFLRDARINMIFEGTNEILHHFIGMNGLKGPGAAMMQMGADAAAPGALARWASSRMPGSALSGLHPTLQGFGDEIAAGGVALGEATRSALVTHGRAIDQRELVQERLAEMATNLYVAIACVSRLDSVLKEKTEAAAADESLVGRRAIADALRRVSHSLAELSGSDDETTRRLAAIAARDRAWSFGLRP